MYIPIWFIVLVVALFVVYRSYERKEKFKPVKICILPNWEEIFKDYNVTNDSSWKEKIPKEHDKYNMYEWGILFTILSPNLIFDNNYNYFRTKIEFERGFGDEVGADSHSFVYVYSGTDGYEFGLKIPQGGGKRKSLEDEFVFVKVATIPFPKIVLYGYGEKKRKVVDQMLQKGGWGRGENDYLIHPEKSLKHKYLEVWYEYI